MREATFSSWGLMTAWGGVVWVIGTIESQDASPGSPLSDVTEQPTPQVVKIHGTVPLKGSIRLSSCASLRK